MSGFSSLSFYYHDKYKQALHSSVVSADSEPVEPYSNMLLGLDITYGSHLSTKTDDKTLLQTDDTLAAEQMCQKLVHLERELDLATNNTAVVTGVSAATTSSHANATSTMVYDTTLNTTSDTEAFPSNGNDAWSEAPSMQLIKDSLQAEVTRKEQLPQTTNVETEEGEKMTNDLVDSLIEEDYDVDEKATIGIVTKDISATTTTTPSTATTNPVSASTPSIGSDVKITSKTPLPPPRPSHLYPFFTLLC